MRKFQSYFVILLLCLCFIVVTMPAAEAEEYASLVDAVKASGKNLTGPQRIVGDGLGSFASPSTPVGVAYDPSRGGIWHFTEAGSIVLTDSSGGVLDTLSLVGIAIPPDGSSNGGDVLPNGNLIIADYNGDGDTTIDDYLFEVDPDTGTLVNYWPLDGAQNTSTDATNINAVTDVEMGPNGHAFVVNAGDNNIYEIALVPGNPGTWSTVNVHAAPAALTTVTAIERVNCPYDGWWLSDLSSTTVAFVDSSFNTVFSFSAAHDGNIMNSGVTLINDTDPMQLVVTDFDTVTTGLFDSGQFPIDPSDDCMNVLYWNDHVLETDYMAQALVALSPTHSVTRAVSDVDFNAKVAQGGWDLVILAVQNFDYFSYSLSNFENYVANGGAAIFSDFSEDATAGALFGVTYNTGNENDTSVTISDKTLKTGISTIPLGLVNTGWSIFSMGMAAVSGETAATFSTGDAAIVIGNDGRTIINGFLTDTAGAIATDGITLYKNEIKYLTVTDVTVLSPNGREVITGGTPYMIRWKAPVAAKTFKIKFTKNNGLTWKVLGKGLTGTGFLWTTPSVSKTKSKCLIKVIAYDKKGNKVDADVSDRKFTIQP